MDSFQLLNGYLVGLYLLNPRTVVASSSYIQDGGKVFTPSWCDLVQNG